MDAVAGLAPGSGLIAAACTALGLSRASLHRRQAFRRQPLAPVRRRPPPMRALVAQERQVVLNLLREPRFVDLAPAEVYACLLDQGLYLCSIRTMYRILAEHDEVRERRRQLRRPVYQKPELLAESPNQVWSWDITKLMGPVKWSYFYLYVIIDIFSRRIVAWQIADAESAALSGESGEGIIIPRRGLRGSRRPMRRLCASGAWSLLRWRFSSGCSPCVLSW